MRPLIAVVAVLGLGLTSTAFAHDYHQGDLHIEHPWSRATPAGAGVGAGYMVIRNEGRAPDRLLSGGAPFAGRVEIHEMAMEGGVMRMRDLPDGFEIPAGATVTLEPGGFHVMFMRLLEPLVEGETHTATLVFERAGPIELEFHVEAMGASSHDHSHSHSN